MKTLDRYVLKTFLAALLVTTIALVGVLLVIDIFSRLDKFLQAKDVSPFALLLRYYGCRAPLIFVWLAPMASLAAMMLTLTRFARANELLPVLVAGRSLRRFLLPTFLAAAAVSALMFLIDEKISPALGEEFRETDRLFRGNREIENVVISDREGQDWFAEKYDAYQFRLKRVYVVRLGPDFNRLSDVRGDDAVWDRDARGWRIMKGVETVYDPQTQRRVKRNPIPDGGMMIPSDLKPSEIEEADQVFRMANFAQLDRNIQKYPFQPFWRVQWHSKFAMPAANLILLIVGVPLLLRSGTRNFFAGVGISLAAGGAFLGTILAFLDAGNTGKIDPILAVWFPIVLFGAVGAALLDGMNT